MARTKSVSSTSKKPAPGLLERSVHELRTTVESLRHMLESYLPGSEPAPKRSRVAKKATAKVRTVAKKAATAAKATVRKAAIEPGMKKPAGKKSTAKKVPARAPRAKTTKAK
jgi:hypothetical protein